MATVVVTGIGATSPLGGDVGSTWKALLAGESGVTMDTVSPPCSLATGGGANRRYPRQLQGIRMLEG